MYILFTEEGWFLFFSQQPFPQNARRSREMYNTNGIGIIAYDTNIIQMKVQVHPVAVQFVLHK